MDPVPDSQIPEPPTPETRTFAPTASESPASGPPAARPDGAAADPSSGSADRILTIPNLISFARLVGVPVFLWLQLGLHAKVAALIVLAVGGSSDWVDGYLARRLNQVSRLGEMMDPIADRLYIFATLVAFTVSHVVPWSFAIALVVRDLMLVVCLLVLRRYGFGPPAVHYVGKTATFILLFAFPVLLLAKIGGPTAGFFHASGWGLAWWGIVLYWIAGLFYVIQVVTVVRDGRAGRGDPRGVAAAR